MGKYVSDSILAMLQQKTGTDPYFLLAVNWGAGISWYTTRDVGVPGYNNNIINLGSLRNQKHAENMSNTASVAVTLSDTDGMLKFTIDNVMAEKAPAALYLAFAGTSPADFVQLIKGKVVGPVQWNEGERTCSFDVETVIESHELGYSATEEVFSDINPEAAGVPWPLIFGTCAHVPALHVRKHHEGRLQCAIRFFKDPAWRVVNNGSNLILEENPDTYAFLAGAPEKNVFYVEDGDKFPQGVQIKVVIDDVIFLGTFAGTKFTIAESNVPKHINVAFGNRGPITDPDTFNISVAWLNDPSISIVNCHCYIQAANVRQWYNYCIRQEGTKCWFRYPFISPVTNRWVLINSTNKIATTYGITVNGMSEDIESEITELKNKFRMRRAVAGKHPFGGIIARLAKMRDDASSWWTAQADTKVRLWDQNDPDIYVVSIVEMTAIKAVFGKRKIRTLDGKTREVFEQIPDSYYQVQLRSNYPIRPPYINSPLLFPTGILFFKALSDYAGQDWDDEIYVTGTSSVGPNSSDIIKWILANWTDLVIDTSFQDVRAAVGVYPANFAIFDQRDALKTAQEIAFQARCGLLLDSEAVSLIYLPVQPVQQWNFDESSTELGSLVLKSTGINDIITKYIATWTDTYREKEKLAQVRHVESREFEHILHSMVKSNRRGKSETHYTVYENNIERFGCKPHDQAVYIYNYSEAIQAFLNFWGFRLSNSWQLVEFRAALPAVRLQPFDGVVIQFVDIKVGLVMGVLESLEFNPSDLTITLEVWIPAFAGHNFTEPGAWPG